MNELIFAQKGDDIMVTVTKVDSGDECCLKYILKIISPDAEKTKGYDADMKKALSQIVEPPKEYTQ